MSIVINTPTGNIGRRVVERLLAAGENVTVIHRNPEKVRPLAERGVRVVQGSLDDSAALDHALKGAETLFWLTPPPFQSDFLTWAVDAAHQAARAARAHGVRRVVVLSSTGAHNGPNPDPVGILLGVEDAFRAEIANVTVLRPGYFMENLLHSVGTLPQGALYHVLPRAVPFPLVATRDIGDKAAEALLDRAWTGHRLFGVHGPADLTHDEMAAVLSEELGHPVRYEEISIEQLRQGMLESGMPPFLADLYAELYRRGRDGYLEPAEPRTPESTTPTPFRDFIREVLRPAIESAAAA
jgi:uncharacterized protein YbjT (DUF2867 family)